VVRREVVGAHYGWRDWLAQRVTAVVMFVYTVFVLVAVARVSPLDYPTWQSLWQAPIMRYATILFVVSVLIHAWIGVRNILMDYVKHTGVRLVLFVLVILALVAYGFWAVQILWG
jgi:succinate dehydrogenase / fumarate reductase membrane anchor subunit